MSCFAADPPKVVRWRADDPQCKVVFSDGIPYERFNSSSVLIDIQVPSTYDKHVNYLLVGVVNRSGADLEVNPAGWRAQAEDGDGTEMPVVDADSLFAKDQKKDSRRQAIGNALSGFGAGMQQHTATVNNSDGSTSTVTYKDPNDVRNANASAASRATNLSGQYARMSSVVLRRNTVAPGGFVVGTVYFERPKGLNKKVAVGMVSVVIGDTTYLFPFHDGTVPK